jgi:hypothetical protein
MQATCAALGLLSSVAATVQASGRLQLEQVLVFGPQLIGSDRQPGSTESACRRAENGRNSPFESVSLQRLQV